MTKVLLVSPITHNLEEHGSNVNLAIIASYLTQNTDCRVEILDMDADYRKLWIQGVKDPYQSCLKALEGKMSKSDYAGFTCMDYTFPIILKTLGNSKNDLGELPTVFTGGVHPSSETRSTLEESEGLIDIVVRGLGEVPTAKILTGEKLENIPNIAYRRGGTIRINPDIYFTPFDGKIETEFLEKCIFEEDGEKVLYEIYQFFCTNFCDYCACLKIPGIGVVHRDPNTVVEEIADMEKFGLEHIYFIDDNHFINPKGVERLNRLLREYEIDIKKRSFLDPQLITPELIEKVKGWGYAGFFLGRDFITNELASIYGRKFNGRPRDVESEKEKFDYLFFVYDDEQFDDKMNRLSTLVVEQMNES